MYETINRWFEERGLKDVKAKKTPHRYMEYDRFNNFVAVGRKEDGIVHSDLPMPSWLCP